MTPTGPIPSGSSLLEGFARRHGDDRDAPRVAILAEADRFADVYPLITASVVSAQPFRATPFFLALAGDPGLQGITGLHGVVGVDALDDFLLGLLDGIDRAVWLMAGFDSEWAVGGVEEGEPYPAVYGAPGGTVAPPARCAAVNLSLAPPKDHLLPTRPEDCVNHATRYLAGWAVPVMPSGNGHSAAARFETVSPWAEPPWVLCVGATADEAGDEEWEHSGRGTAARPDVMPDLLAWGQNPYLPDDFGTSFAVARVTAMLALARAWLLQVAANVDRLAGRPFGVPLVGVDVIDRGFAGDPGFDELQDWQALPVLESTAPARALARLEELVAQLHHPSAARSILEAAARETSTGVGLSAPSLTLGRLEAFLDGLTAEALARLLGVQAGTTGGEPLFEAGTAGRLWVLVRGTMPVWQWDIETRVARMRHPERGGTA